MLPASGDTPRATLVLNEPETLSRMVTPPIDLSSGEAYLRGDVTVEGDLEAVVEALQETDWYRDVRGEFDKIASVGMAEHVGKQQLGASKRYAFPDGEIVPLWETLQAAESLGLETRDVEDLREHYATTLRHWVRNLEAEWERATGEIGEERARIWRLYMSASAHQFASGHLAVHQVLLAKPDARGRVPLPASRSDIYRTA